MSRYILLAWPVCSVQVLTIWLYISILSSKHGLTEYLQLVRARLESPIVQYIVKSPFDTQPRTILPCCSSLSLNLAFLQGDIIAHYLSGKPSIKSINSLRIVFKFKQERKSCAVKNKQDSE